MEVLTVMTLTNTVFWDVMLHISLEAFAATEFSKIFSVIWPHQGVKVLHHFRDRLHPHLQGVADCLVRLKLITRCPIVCCVYLLCPARTEVFTIHRSTPSYQFWFYQAISSTLKMGTESVHEMLENFHTLTQLYVLACLYYPHNSYIIFKTS